MRKTPESTVRADFIEQELKSYEYFCERTGKADQRIACHGFYGFNNKPGISDATRELVLKTAAEYGYAPKKMKPPALPPALFSWSIIKSTERSLPTRRFSPS